jgi:hypothetical protein
MRTLGSSVDTTTKALNPSTTLGDIEYRSATANTNTRLGIGTSGQILAVSGGVPAWTTVAGGGANWSLLNAGGTALSGTETSITGISGQDKLLIIIKDASHTSAFDSPVEVRFNSSTGNLYTEYGIYIMQGSSYSTSNMDVVSQTTNNIDLGGSSTNAACVTNSYLFISGCNSAGVKAYHGAGSGNAAGGNSQVARTVAGVYDSTSTVSSVQITYSSALTFDGGTVFIYGSA